jgi:hypothetical protein
MRLWPRRTPRGSSVYGECMRCAMLLVLTGVATLLCTGAVLAAGAAQRQAMSRCLATPPGFPRGLSRAGTEITVEWKVFPFSYKCRYVTQDDVVTRPPP